MGKSDEALAAYQQALKVSNGSPQIAVAAASLYFDLGRLDEAETHAKMALGTHASFAHGLLAQIALQRNDLGAAEREARAAMDEKSLRLGPMITLAEVLHARKDDAGALELTRKAAEVYNQREAKDPELIRGLALIQGKLLADQGDAEGAEKDFKQEIAMFPDSLRAYSNLAILYALTGRNAEVSAALQSLVQKNPYPPAYAEAVKTLRILNDPGSATKLLRYAQGRLPGGFGVAESWVGASPRLFRVAVVSGSVVPFEASPPAPLHFVERGGSAATEVPIGCALRNINVGGARSAPYEMPSTCHAVRLESDESGSIARECSPVRGGSDSVRHRRLPSQREGRCAFSATQSSGVSPSFESSKAWLAPHSPAR